MSVPYTYDDTMRVHDKAIFNWLGTLPIDYEALFGNQTRNGFPILRVESAPNQAFASIPDLLVGQGWITDGTAAQMRATAFQRWPVLPLPFASISRGEPKMDPEQAGGGKVFTQKYLNPQTGSWDYHQWPRHMNTPYSITFWSNKRYDEAYIREWIYSSLGKRGTWQNEMLIPVVHPLPWGTINQRLRFDGSTDLSQLETEDQRFIRFECQFDLRTLVFVPIVGGALASESQGFDLEFMTDGFGTSNNTMLAIPNTNQTYLQYSSNLFFFGYKGPQIPLYWPKQGSATVVAGDKTPAEDKLSLEIGVTTTSDSVALSEAPNLLDTDNKVIVGVSLQYESTGAPVNLRISSHDTVANTVAVARLQPLVAEQFWTPVHIFALTNKETTIVDLVGSGSVSDLFVSGIDIRQIYDGSRIAYGSTSVSGPNTSYKWSALLNQPYLVVFHVNAASPSSNTVTCQNDLSSPTVTQSQVVDPSVGIGLVFFIQPLGSSLVVTAPSSLGVDHVYLLPYTGSFDGSSV